MNLKPDNKITIKALTKLKYRFKTIASKKGGVLMFNGTRVQLLVSFPVDLFVDGSKNGLKLSGVGTFCFPVDDLIDIYIFAFENIVTNEAELIIVPKEELKQRLCRLNLGKDNQVNIRFWLTNQGIYETHGIGAEFEFMGLWLDDKRFYNEYLNNLDRLEESSEKLKRPDNLSDRFQLKS